MKGKTAFHAMEGIDPRYILEAAPDAAVRKGSKAPYIRILAVAAAVAALTAVAVLGAGILKQSGDNPPVVPPVGETQDAQTPAEGENETAAPQNGSYSTDLYTVAEIDGKHYLNFFTENHPPEQETSNGSDSIIVIPTLHFSSVASLQKKLLTGDWTEGEINILKQCSRWTDNGFEVPDAHNLYDAVFPSGWSVYGDVDYHGPYYYITARNDACTDDPYNGYDGESASVSLFNDSKYEYDHKLSILSVREKGTLIETWTEYDGVPCEVYEYDTSVATIRVIILKLEQDGDVKEIAMNYCLDHTRNPDVIDPDHPYLVYIFGDKDGVKYCVRLHSMKTAPGVEFLSSFGIKPVELTE